MPGYAPPLDAPDIPDQLALGVSASFEPPVGEICGFGIPGFGFNASLTIPFPDFAFPPTFFFAIALKCDLSDPIDGKVGFGGGRIGSVGLDEDVEF